MDVVNGGCPYYTTAEMIGALAFRGIYTEPDIVLIHEGGNDTAPFRSPREYSPDYSHWRTADNSAVVSSKLVLFQIFWRFPSYLVGIAAWKYLKPDPFQRQTLGRQIDSPQDALLATNDISGRINTGYRRNLITLATLARAHGATPIFITWNWPKGRLHYLVPELLTDQALFEQVENRTQWAMDHNNNIMVEVGRTFSIPVIPFHLWRPSQDDLWVDQCHLNDRGCREKAEYIGSWLIKQGHLNTEASIEGLND